MLFMASPRDGTSSRTPDIGVSVVVVANRTPYRM